MAHSAVRSVFNRRGFVCQTVVVAALFSPTVAPAALFKPKNQLEQKVATWLKSYTDSVYVANDSIILVDIDPLKARRFYQTMNKAFHRPHIMKNNMIRLKEADVTVFVQTGRPDALAVRQLI